jgi:hypothetical protein
MLVFVRLQPRPSVFKRAFPSRFSLVARRTSNFQLNCTTKEKGRRAKNRRQVYPQSACPSSGHTTCIYPRSPNIVHRQFTSRLSALWHIFTCVVQALLYQFLSNQPVARNHCLQVFDDSSLKNPMAESVEESEIVERLAARARIPELDPFHVAKDWRADAVRGISDYCETCRWNGRWVDISNLSDRLWILNKAGVTIDLLEQSASAGNLCCGVALALVRKFYTTSVRSSNRQGYELLREAMRDIAQIYLHTDENVVDTPLGATLYTQGRHPHIDPRSDAALSWAQGHIHDCVHNHDCSNFYLKTRSLPTRLIYIPENVSNGCIRLVPDTTSLPPNTRYTSLTHCWGKIEPQCLTTIKSIKIYSTAGIPWATIPQTFRDALQYTRRLGLEYIWIDSICVIQKNERDWEQESTRMFDYYSNAYVTLGSIFGADGTAGFFSERHIQASTLYLFDIIFKGVKLGVYARRSVNEELKLYQRDSMPGIELDSSPFPLLTRAWTFQERLVSPRLLLFTQYELFPECYAGRSFHNSQESDFPWDMLKRQYKLLLSEERYPDRPGDRDWGFLVGSFTALRITVVTDKLPAFAAVAQQYLSHKILAYPPEEEYLCGLRKSHLHYDLHWSAPERSIDDDKAPFIRGSTYLAPSWSWASVPRPVTYPSYFIQRRHSTIVLEGDHLTFTKAGRFGRALGGHITIRGPVIDCVLPPTWQKGDDLNVCSWNSQELRLQDGREDSQFSFSPDFACGYKELEADGKQGSEIIIYLLQIWADDALVDELGHPENEALGFLALLRNPGSKRYHRLGVGFQQRDRNSQPEPDSLKERFKNAEERILEIE